MDFVPVKLDEIYKVRNRVCRCSRQHIPLRSDKRNYSRGKMKYEYHRTGGMIKYIFFEMILMKRDFWINNNETAL